MIFDILKNNKKRKTKVMQNVDYLNVKYKNSF